jgi:hypothetical protein
VLLTGGGVTKCLMPSPFIQLRPAVESAEGAICSSMPREVAFLASWRLVTGVSMVIWGKTVKAPAFHLVLEECSARWFVQGAG